MTKIEALELELAARKLVEGTELEWWSVIRIEGNKPFEYAPILRGSYTGEHQLAIGIVEGKPVWKGDSAYWTDNKGETFKITVGHLNTFTCAGWSWIPPKPKTVMVELTTEDAKQISVSEYIGSNHYVYARLAEACRKALEKSK